MRKWILYWFCVLLQFLYYFPNNSPGVIVWIRQTCQNQIITPGKLYGKTRYAFFLRQLQKCNVWKVVLRVSTCFRQYSDTIYMFQKTNFSRINLMLVNSVATGNFVREWTVRESPGNFGSRNGRYGKVREILGPGMDGTGTYGNPRTVPYGKFPVPWQHYL